MEDHNLITTLFKKYVAVQCSPDEIQLLFKLINQKENENLFRQLIANELDFIPVEPNDTGPEDKAIFKVNSILITEIRSQLNTNNYPKSKLKTILNSEWVKIAAIWLVIGSSTLFLFYRYFSNKTTLSSTHTKELITRQGQRKLIRLYDGTKIWLSPSSTLHYQDQLVNKLREVTLDGEAYFEVAKDKDHPFIIHSGRMQTQVVGTSFNVKSYNKLKLYSVTVVTGMVKVAVMSSNNEKLKEIILKPKQQVVFNLKQVQFSTRAVADLLSVIKKRDGILTYDGTPVPEVIAELKRYYKVPIELENKSMQCLCFGEFDTSRPLNIVLTQLAAAIGAEVVKVNDGFTLSGGCDER